jgi:hypothetical protein
VKRLATGSFQRATRIINRATGSTHRATCTAAQLHATVLALQPRVLALQPRVLVMQPRVLVLQPIVPHLRSFHRLCRLGIGRLLEHLRAPDHLPEPAAHVHRALLREIPPARRTPIPAAASRQCGRCGTRHAAHDPPGVIPGYSTRWHPGRGTAAQGTPSCARAGPARGGARGRRADFAAAGHAAVGAAARGPAGTAVTFGRDPLTAGLIL